MDKNKLKLTPKSVLKIRTGTNNISDILLLTGKTLNINDEQIRLGVPKIYPLKNGTTLYSNIVVIKGYQEESTFKEALMRQLKKLDINGEVMVGKRKVFRIKGRTIIGFSVKITQLTADESICLQEQGVGGKRHMGCGIFNVVGG